jgi:hypothetical protein
MDGKDMRLLSGRSLACFGTGIYDSEVREMGYPVE